MFTRSIYRCAVVGLIIGAATSAHAQSIVYSQLPNFAIPGLGLPSHNEIAGGANNSYLADNFQLPATENIGQIRWWGNNNGGNYQDLSNLTGFTIEIWSGDFRPLGLLYSETYDLASTNPVDTGYVGEFNGATVFEHTVDLSIPFSAGANTTYFVAVIANQTDSLDEWYWHDSFVGDPTPGDGVYIYDADMWFSGNFPWARAFEVISVPAPSSVAIVGLAGLAATRRRRS